MKRKVYYVGHNGQIYNRQQLETSFYLLTGVSPSEHEGRFLTYLWNRIGFGRPIAYYFTPTVEDLVLVGRTVEATKMYREERGCTLSEAYEHISQIRKNQDMKGDI